MSIKYKFRNPDGLYFVTFGVVDWVDVFTRKVYRDLFLESLDYCIKNKGLVIYGYVLMSNHVHLIISRKDDSVLLEDIMRDMKKFSAFRILKEIKESLESRREWMLSIFSRHGANNSNNRNYQFWQQDNHPIELDPHTSMFDQKLNYIHQNPVMAGIVDRPEDYVYSSARDYVGIKGLLDIEVLDH